LRDDRPDCCWANAVAKSLGARKLIVTLRASESWRRSAALIALDRVAIGEHLRAIAIQDEQIR